MGNSISAEIPKSAAGLELRTSTPLEATALANPRNNAYNFAYGTATGLRTRTITDSSGVARFSLLHRLTTTPGPSPIGLPVANDAQGNNEYEGTIGQVRPQVLSLHHTCHISDSDELVAAVAKTAEALSSAHDTEIHVWLFNPKVPADDVSVRGLPDIVIGGSWSSRNLFISRLVEGGKRLEHLAKVVKWNGDEGHLNKADFYQEPEPEVDSALWFRVEIAADVDNSFIFLLLQAVSHMLNTEEEKAAKTKRANH